MLGLLLAAMVLAAPGPVDAFQADSATQAADEVPSEPSVVWRVGRALVRFLFGSIIGWWVVIVILFVAASPFIGRYRAWKARRRFIRAQGAKLVNPDNAEARFQLAELCLESRKWRQAAQLAEEAVGIASVSPVYAGAVPYGYLRALGQARYKCGRWADALEAFDRALKVKSELGYADALLGISKARYRMGAFKEALEFAKHAVAEQESRLESYFRWAQAAAALGRQDELGQARERFWKTALRLPRYNRQRRLWWRLAFLAFPLTRRLG